MRVASILFAIIIFLSVLSGCNKVSVPYVHKPDFDPVSSSVFLVDMATGDIIYEKNSDKLVYPSGLTQMVTAILAIEETANIDEEITVTEDLAVESRGDVSPLDGLAEGEKYSMEQLLHCMIMGSDSNAAQLIAATVGGGDINNFISRMNERSKTAGTKSTNFVNANGTHDTNNYTTARDIAAIALVAAANPTYMQIASTLDYTIPKTDSQKERLVTNDDKIINLADENNYCANVQGVKFGGTEDTGNNLVCLSEQNGIKIMAVLMGVPYAAANTTEGTVYSDAKKLFEWAFSTCRLALPPAKGKPVLSLDVSADYSAKELPLQFEKTLEKSLPKDVAEKDVSFLCRVPAAINKPVNKGDVIGSADILYKSEKIQTVNLVAGQSLKAKAAGQQKSGTVLTVVIILVSLFIILLVIRQINIIRYRKKRQKVLDEKRRQIRRNIEQESERNRPPLKR